MTTGELETTLNRISKHQGVLGTVIVTSDGEILREVAAESLQGHLADYASLIPGLAHLARSLVRDLDPQNELEFLRLRSTKHEIMVAPHTDFVLIVIQEPHGGE